MKSLFLFFTILVVGFAPLHAQPAAPAQPVSPDQARPATPVNVDELTPNPQGGPATSPAPSTNAASPAQTPPVGVSVIAESSLKAVLSELAQTWADDQPNSPQMPISFTSSGIILTQVQAAPDYDVVISADIDDIKSLTDKGVLVAGGQQMLARNSVVIYGRKALLKDDDLEWFDLIGNEWKAVAMGKPDQVTSGRVAEHALQKHDLLDDDHKQLYNYVMTDNLVLQAIKSEKADAVFVYKTDAAKLNLNGFEIYPLDSADAPPVFYTAAVGSRSRNPAQARSFIDFCASDAAKAIWAKYGFETN